jgi:hypothetical protein
MNYHSPSFVRPEPDYGPDLSYAGEQALAAHAEVQALITKLREALATHDGAMCFDRYETLVGELEDTARTPAEIESVIYEEEAQRREDAAMDAAERRWEARRDEDMGL